MVIYHRCRHCLYMFCCIYCTACDKRCVSEYIVEMFISTCMFVRTKMQNIHTRGLHNVILLFKQVIAFLVQKILRPCHWKWWFIVTDSSRDCVKKVGVGYRSSEVWRKVSQQFKRLQKVREYIPLSSRYSHSGLQMYKVTDNLKWDCGVLCSIVPKMQQFSLRQSNFSLLSLLLAV